MKWTNSQKNIQKIFSGRSEIKYKIAFETKVAPASFSHFNDTIWTTKSVAIASKTNIDYKGSICQLEKHKVVVVYCFMFRKRKLREVAVTKMSFAGYVYRS